MKNILINICENNNAGNRSGYCTKIEFINEDGLNEYDLDAYLRLDAKTMFDGGEPINTEGHNIVMYDHIIKCTSCAEWYGNRMWNTYTVPANYALGFLNLLKRKKRFDMESALENIFQKWDNAFDDFNALDFGITDPFIHPTISLLKKAK